MAKDSYFVNCPFYKKDDPVNVRCEGIGKNNRIILQFHTKSGKESHMRKFCKHETDYKECAIYKMLMKKYEDKG